MKKSFLNTKISLCECVTDCVEKTDKAVAMSKSKPNSFNARERQFFLLLPNNDSLSKKVRTNIADKVDLNQLLEAGLIKQTKKCINFKHLLTQNKHQNKQPQVKQPEQNIAVDPLLQFLSGR